MTHNHTNQNRMYILRDSSLITGEGGLQNGRGGACEVLPLQKKGGGAEKVLAMKKGGTQQVLGQFLCGSLKL